MENIKREMYINLSLDQPASWNVAEDTELCDMSPEIKMLGQVTELSKWEKVESWEELKGKGFRFCCLCFKI